jgi:hypothetical protein
VTNEKQILPDEQFGFRPQHSTSDQILHVTEFIAKSNGQRHSTGAIFLDVAKAFDTVWHGGLVYKLHVAGVPLAMVKLINSFLQNRNFHAKIGMFSQRNATSRQASHRARCSHRLCTQSSLPTFRSPTKQRSRCMQTTLQFSRAPGRP